MEQCRANPCVFWKMDNKKVVLVLVVNVDNLLVSRNETVVKSCSMFLMASSPPKTSCNRSGTRGVL